MKLLLYIALLILLLYGIACLRIGYKRIRLYATLSKLCRKHGWTLFGTHKLWLFSGNGCKNCDVHLFTGRHLYCIKLFAVRYRRTVLCLCEGRQYYIRQFLGLIGMATSATIPVEGKRKTMPAYHFRYRLKPEWDTAQIHNILLLNPVCMEVNTYGNDGKRDVVAGTGDRYYDMQLYSLARLCARMELDNEEQPYFNIKF